MSTVTDILYMFARAICYVHTQMWPHCCGQPCPLCADRIVPNTCPTTPICRMMCLDSTTADGTNAVFTMTTHSTHCSHCSSSRLARDGHSACVNHTHTHMYIIV